MKTQSLFELGNFFLRSCPYMKGMAEAWNIENMVLVSPAVFQLLTDEGDIKTVYLVAQQLLLRRVTYDDIKDLVAQKWDTVSTQNNKYITVHFQITMGGCAEQSPPPFMFWL